MNKYLYSKANQAFKKMFSEHQSALLLLLLFVISATAWAGNTPTGRLEVCTGGHGSIHLLGWCEDPDAPSTPLEVCVYVKDANNNAVAGYNPKVLTANKKRNGEDNQWHYNGYDDYLFIANADTYKMDIFVLDATGDASGMYSRSVQVSAPYTVTYNANGGSSAPAQQLKGENIPLTLSSTDPAHAGHRFLRWTTAQGGGGTAYSPGGTYTDNADVTLYAQWEATYIPGQGTKTDPYVISSAGQWNLFANEVNRGNNYSGKFLRLDADINVSTMAGTHDTPFCGTFMGNGHTMNLSINGTGTGGGHPNIAVAPFRYVNGATFTDLNLTGTVTRTDYPNDANVSLGSLIGVVWQYRSATITGCRSSVNVSYSFSWENNSWITGHMGGFIGWNDGDVTFTDCLFDGNLAGRPYHLGGFVGWHRWGSMTLNNCLMNGTGNGLFGSGGFRYTFCGLENSVYPSFNNCYYKNKIVRGQGTETSATGETLRALLGSNWIVRSNAVVPGRTLTLSCNANNSTAINNANNMNYDQVILSGLTLYRNGNWNTICLPFNLNSFTGTPLEGATVKTLVSSAYSNGTLTLNFANVSSITAGKPYIVKWNSGSDIVNPVFNNVTISKTTANVATTNASFIGSYAPFNNNCYLYDTNNPGRMAMHAALSISNPAMPTGFIFGGWYTDAGLTTPVTTIPFNADGSVTLYAFSIFILNLANNADNGNSITQASNSGVPSNVTLTGYTLYRDGSWNTLCLPFDVDDFTGTPLEGAIVKTPLSSTCGNGVLTMNFSDNLTAIQAGKPYILKWTEEAIYQLNADLIIRSTADWNAFATNVTNGTESYQGKTVKLAADITVTTMAGANQRFKGTFDGCGHTLTFNYNATANDCAPFRYIEGATIRNLRVAGTITTSKKCAAGIVAKSYNNCTIENSQSSITISSSVNGDGTHGGFVACPQSGKLTFRNCLFDGKLLGSNTNNSGGFVGWRTGGSIVYTSCLFAPTQRTMSTSGSCTFNRNGGSSFTSAFYTQAFGTIQGTAVGSKTTAQLASALGDGWEVSGNKVVPILDDIVNPQFNLVTANSATNNVTTAYADFIGSYAPFADNSYLLDTNNPNGNAMHAALRVNEENVGYRLSLFTDAEHNNAVTTIPFGNDGKVTLYYNQESRIEFSISYDLDGGSVETDNPTSFNVESDDITLVNPTREGYEFVGWTGTGLSKPTKTITIPAGSTQNRSYTAVWTELYSISYNGLVEGTFPTEHPTSYTVLSETFTLINPVRDLYDFKGWTGTGLTQPTMTVTIPKGSTGDRTYTATWSLKEGQYVSYNPETGEYENHAVSTPTHLESTSATEIGTAGQVTWYMVKKKGVIASEHLTVNGVVNLILADGASLTAQKGINVHGGNSLIVYGQQGGTGTLNATGIQYMGGSNWESAAIGSDGNGNGNINAYLGDLTFHGGVINATGYEEAAAIGGGHWNPATGSITIYGGTISAKATEPSNGNQEAIGHGASGGNVRKTIVDGLRVYKNYSTNPTLVEYAYRIQNGLSQKDVRVERCTEHNYQNGRCSYCGAYQYHQITYLGNGNTGGTAPAVATCNVTIGITTATGTVAEAGTLERTGYSFAGWNTAADGSGTDYAPGATIMLLNNLTLYAQWTLDEYTITYNLDGGTLPEGESNPTTYTIESWNITLTNPTRLDVDENGGTNYLFMGWTGTDLDAQTLSVTIPHGSTGDRIYTATWDVNEIPFEGMEIDHDFKENEVGRYYIKMPVPEHTDFQIVGKDEWGYDIWEDVIIPAEENPKTVNIPEWFTTSFKVYDNGGKNTDDGGSYQDYMYYPSDDNITTLILNAPEGKVFSVSGGIAISTWYGDWLKIYDGTTTSDPILLNNYGGYDYETGAWEITDGSIPFVTTGNSIRFDLYCDNDLTQYGLDLIVSVTDAPTNITLANEDSQLEQKNTSVIASNDGEYANVTLDGRTLYKDGKWNTLCLPFDIDDISVTQLSGATIMTPSSIAFDNETGVLAINTTDASSIEAGKSYLVKWDVAYTVTNGSTYWEDNVDDCLVDGHKEWDWMPNDDNGFCEFETSGTREVTGYTLTTCGYENYTPKAWELYGKLDEDDQWTLIDRRNTTAEGNPEDALPTTVTTDKYYTASQPGTYRYFRFVVTTGTEVQYHGTRLGELTLHGDYTAGPADLIENPTFKFVTIKNELHPMTSGTATFGGSYSNVASTASLLLDEHNANGDAFHAALNIIDFTVPIGYTFDWCTDAGLTTPTTTIPFDATTGAVTLYAKCAPNTYTVSFHKNDGGEDEYTDQLFTYGASQALTANAFTRTGYTFRGWNTEADGSGTPYTDGQTVENLTTEQGDLVLLYAQWTLNMSLANNDKELPEEEKNSYQIDEHNYESADVTLQGRTLYKDNTWNTLCLPFDLGNPDDDEGHYFDGTLLEDATVKTLESAVYENGTLTMIFEDAHMVMAGMPYIVKWASGSNLVNPVFTGVTISNATANVETDNADFIGTFSSLVSTDGLLLDSHDAHGDSFHAALSISDPVVSNYLFNGWYTDANRTIPVTTIPFAADGTVTLYAKLTPPLDISDGNAQLITEDEEITVPSLTYERDLSAPADEDSADAVIGGTPVYVYTLCLPYAPATGNGIKYYTLSSSSTSSLKFVEIEDDPVANAPYLVTVSAATSVGSKVSEPVTLKKETDGSVKPEGCGYRFVGTTIGLTNTEAAAKGAYILQDENQWRKVTTANTNAYIPPFRAYIVATGSGARPLLGTDFGDTSDIQSLQLVDRDGTEHWYDLNGRHINKPARKGVYINNGNKVVIK